MFEPENSLEALMQAAVKDPDVVPAFYQALLETEIYVLTPEAPMKPGRRRSLKFQEKINIATVEFKGMKWHPAFTSKKRISDYVKRPALVPPRAICSKCCPVRISGSIRCRNARSRCPPPKSLS